MALIEIYRGDTRRIDLTFSNDDGSRINLSGYTVFYRARDSFSSTGFVFQKTVTGHDVPVSGTTHVDLSSQDTNICAQDYLAAFQLSGSGTPPSVSTFYTDGLRILPNPNIL